MGSPCTDIVATVSIRYDLNLMEPRCVRTSELMTDDDGDDGDDDDDEDDGNDDDDDDDSTMMTS